MFARSPVSVSVREAAGSLPWRPRSSTYSCRLFESVKYAARCVSVTSLMNVGAPVSV